MTGSPLPPGAGGGDRGGVTRLHAQERVAETRCRHEDIQQMWAQSHLHSQQERVAHVQLRGWRRPLVGVTLHNAFFLLLPLPPNVMTTPSSSMLFRHHCYTNNSNMIVTLECQESNAHCQMREGRRGGGGRRRRRRGGGGGGGGGREARTHVRTHARTHDHTCGAHMLASSGRKEWVAAMEVA